jgi:hypothetical protein
LGCIKTDVYNTRRNNVALLQAERTRTPSSIQAYSEQTVFKSDTAIALTFNLHHHPFATPISKK